MKTKIIGIHFWRFLAMSAGIPLVLISIFSGHLAFATPYATDLSNTGFAIIFRLNEAADNVQIISGGGAVTNDLGALGAGVNIAPVAISGPYKVVASKAGTGAISQIGSSIPFGSPRGVTVNVNPASPVFGRVYVANSATNSNNKGDGIFVHNSDLSDAFGQGLVPRTGGITNFGASANSPFRIKVGRDDDKLYICDFSDAAGNLYVTDADVSPASVQYALKPLTTNYFGTNISAAMPTTLGGTAIPVGTNNNHGSVSAVEVVGSLGAGNLQIITVDEDYQTDPTQLTPTEMNSLWRYSIGLGSIPWTNVPTKLFTPTISAVTQTTDLARATNGYLYLSDRRVNGSEAGVFVVNSSGTLLFNSRDESIAEGYGWDVLSNTMAIAVSPDLRYLATVDAVNLVTIIPLTNGIPNLPQRAQYSGFAATNFARALAFDAANNLYIASSGLGALIVLSLGYDSVATTASDGAFKLDSGSPVILSQPQSATNLIGTSVGFSVQTSGSIPLTYQWRINGTNISGATSASLSIANVQLTNAGDYQVVITNLYGAVTTAVASLIVAPAVAAPSGMVNWWAADGNANDKAGSYNGTLVGAIAYVPGKVGSAFHFDGSTTRINLGGVSVPPPWTACFWVNRQDTSMNSAALLGDASNSLKLEQYNFTRATGVSRFGIADDSFGYIAPAGSWVHLTFIGTATNTLLYTNGVLFGSLPVSISLPRRYIGADLIQDITEVDHLLGDLDEIVLFNRILNPAEINTIYAAGNAGLPVQPLPTPPTITVQPQNRTVAYGLHTAFTVSAGGNPPLTFQWRLNGTNLIAATNFSLIVSNATASDAGNYQVVITNSSGAITSQIATLAVSPAVLPTTLAYWRMEGDGVNTPVAGVTQVLDTNGRTTTNTTPGIVIVDMSGNGNTVWAWDHAYGGQTYQSSVPAPTIPTTGATNQFSIQNAGNFPTCMTWSKWSSPAVDIETVAPLAWTIEASILATNLTGNRTFVGRDGNGVATGTVTLKNELGIISNPTTLSGWAPLYFQQRNGRLWIQFTDLSGRTYELADTTGLMSTNTWYNVAAVSDGNTLSLYRDSGSGYQLVGSMGLAFGGDKRLAYDTTGSSTLGDAQWSWTLGRARYGNSDAQPDNHVDRWLGNIDEVRISATALSPSQMLFAATNVYIVSGPSPAAQTVALGNSAAISIIPGGQSTRIQWRHNGMNILNATNLTLVIPAIAVSDSGNYDAVLTNASGAITSSVATISVVSSLASRTMAVGGRVTFLAQTFGVGPFTYQWSFNAIPLLGATNSSLILTNLQISNAGVYSVVVTSLDGNLTSSATLNVTPENVRFAATNLVVVRVGEGSQTLSLTGNSAFMEQFTATGEYVNTVSLPDTGASGVVMSGASFVDGYLSRSLDGRQLCLAVYGTNLSSGLNITTSTVIPRVVATFDANANLTRSISTLSDYAGASWRCATTDGTNNFWGAAATGGTVYLGSNSPRAVVQNAKINCRVVHIFNGNLYMASASAASDARTGIYRFNGLPTTSVGLPSAIVFTNTFNGLNGVTDFAVSPTGTTVYFADDRAPGTIEGGVQRWDFDAGNNVWVNTYHLTNGLPGVGVSHLTVDWSGANPVIYAVTTGTSQNSLVKVADTGAIATFTTLATAGLNQVFRGVKFGPAPDPDAPVILAQPQSRTNVTGTTAILVTTATGAAPLSYQWLFNGTNLADNVRLSGSQASSLTIANVQPGDTGNYQVIVSNAYGIVTSSVAALTVQAPPALLVTCTNSTAVGNGADVEVDEFSGSGLDFSPPGANDHFNAEYDAATRNEVIALRFDLSGYTLAEIQNVRLELVNYRNDATAWTLHLYAVKPGVTGLDNNTNAYYFTNALAPHYNENNWDESAAGIDPTNLLRFSTMPGLEYDGLIATRGFNTNNVVDLGAQTFGAKTKGGLTILSNASFSSMLTAFLNVHPDPLVTLLIGRDDTSAMNARFASKEATFLEGGTPTGAAGDFAPRLVFDVAGKLTPAITWTNPAAISYGVALDTNQLNATAAIAGSFVYTPPAGTVLSVGTNLLSSIFTPLDTTNYLSVTSTVSIVVLKLPLTVIANNASRVYGAGNPAFSGTIIGLQNGDNITASYASPATVTSPPGNYPVVPTLLDPNGRLGNYTVTINNGTLVVTQAIPALSWATPAAITYGTALGGGQLNASVGMGGSYSYNPTAGTVLNVGTNILSVIFTPSDSVDFANATGSVSLVVACAPLTVTANNVSRAYGETNPIFTGSITGLVNGDNITATYSSTAATNSPPGTYPILVTVSDPGNRLGNYNVTTNSGTLTVIGCAAPPAGLVAWWPGEGNGNDMLGLHQGILQSGALFASGMVGQGFVLDSSHHFVDFGQWNPGPQWTVEAWVNSSGPSVGAGLILGNLADCHDWGIAAGSGQFGVVYRQSGGCTQTFYSGTNVIVGRWYHVAASCDGNQVKLYVDGILTGSAVVESNFLPASGVGLGSSVETFHGIVDDPAVYSVALSSNEIAAIYFAGAVGKCNDQIQPAIVSQPQPQSVNGGDMASFSVNVVGTGPLSYRWRRNGVNLTDDSRIIGSQTAALAIANAGTNDIGNYQVVITNLYGSVTSAVATLAVAKVTPLVTWTSPAPITYATALGSAQLNASASVPGSFAYNPATGAFLNVGTNILTAVFTPSNTAAYNGVTNTISLVVNRAPLIVTANNAARAYGVANPVFGGIITGQRAGDGITATFTSGAGTNSPVGTYDILVTLNDPNGKLPNYNVTTNIGILTVIKATPVITWTPPPTIPYGAPLSGAQLNASANVAGSFAYTPLAGTVLGFGTNLISVAFTPTDTSNFNSANANVNVVVNRAMLTVTANSAMRPEGQANPTFTGSLTGVTNADNITATYTSTATEASPPGNYSIFPVLSDPNNRLGNYTVTLVTNSLTVTPLNDMFADRQTISGVSNILTTINLTATAEGGEPSHASYPATHSLWWKWTTPANGTVTLDTIGSSFDTVLAVYAGSALTNLTPVASDDESGGNHSSALTFQADPNVEYQIAVDGYAGATGNITLRLVEIYGPPTFVAQPQSQSVLAGSGVTFNASVTGSRPFFFRWRKDGVDILGATDSQNATNTSFTIPSTLTNNSGHYTVLASNSFGTTLSAVATLNVFLRPDNDAYASATVITGQTAQIGGNNIYATRDGFEPALFAGRSVWWKWTAPTNGTVIVDTIGSSFDTVLGLYTNMAPNQGLVKSDDQSGGNNAARLTFDTAAGATYYFGVDGSQWASVLSRTGNIALNLVMQFLPPQISTQPQSLSAELGWDAAFAVTATGTTPLSYQWRKNGADLVGATNSSYAIASIQPGDDGDYSVVVSNAFGTATSVNGTLTIYAAPANDSFADRMTISGLTGNTTGVNVGATKEFSEPSHAGNQGGRSVWWSWTAPTNGTVIISTIGSSFDTLLGVYTGTSVSGLTLVASDNNSGGNLASRVVFSAVANTTYQIAVDGSYPAGAHGAAFGSIVLNWQQAPLFPPLILTDPQSLAAAAGNTVTFNSLAAGSPAPTYQWLKDGAILAGKTNATLVLVNVQTNQSAFYSVRCSNIVGVATSALAQLRVQKALNPSYRGSWPGFQTGEALDVAVEDSLAYVATGAGFLILDVGDPFGPRRIGSYNTDSAATRIAASKGFVYLLNSSNQISTAKLSRFDARNPALPRRLVEYPSTDARDFALGGDYVSLIDGQSLKVLNTNAALVGTLNPGAGFGNAVAAAEGVTYVSWANSVRAYSLANPSSPAQTANINQSPAALAATDNYLFTLTGGQRVVQLRVLDPGNGVRPELGVNILSNTLGQADQQALAVTSNAAFVVTAAASGNGLGVYDLSQPGNPILVGTSLFPDGTPHHITVADDYAFVAAGGAGVKIFDVFDRTNPVPVGQFFTAIQVNAVALQGNRAFAMDKNTGFHVIDVSDATSPISLGSYQTTNGAAAIAVKSHYVYLAQDAPPTSIRISGPSLEVVDVADPEAPQLLGSVTLPSPALVTLPQSGDPSVKVTALAVAGNLVLVGSYVTNVQTATHVAALGIVDVSNPGLPQVVSRYDLSGTAQIKRIDFQGRYAFVADQDFGLRVVDLMDPANPVEVGAFAESLPTTSVSVRSNVCLLTGTFGTVQLDVTDPAHPVPLGSNSISGTLDWLQSPLALGYGADGIKAYDLITLTNPLVLGQFAGSYPEVVVQGRYAFAAGDEAGLTILDLGANFSTPPAILDPPVNTRVLAGESAVFYVGVTGTMPLSYQWRFNGADLPGETEPTLWLPNVQPEHAGQYSVLVANTSGSVTSALATLSVNLAPTVALTQPSDHQAFAPPANIVLTAVAADPDGMIKQVRFYEGATLLGVRTNAPFTLTVSNKPLGGYSFTAQAVDNENAVTESIPVLALVTNLPLIQLSAANYLVNESNGVALITVQRNFTGPAAISLYTLAGSARPSVNGGAGSYLTVSNTVAFAADAFETNVYVPVVNDLIYRGNRSFSLLLTNPSAGWMLAYPSNALVTIVDDDSPATTNSFTDVLLPNPAPTELGSLQVTLNPPEALGSWRFNWETEWRASGSIAAGLVPGEQTVEFIPRTGFVTPATTNFNIVSGENIFTNTYTSDGGSSEFGALSIALLPQSVRSGTNRAQWRLQGESGTNWYDSGTIVSGLPVGFHIVEFKTIQGYETPPARLLSVVVSFTNYNQATYSALSAAAGAGPVVLPSFGTISNGLGAGLPYAFNGQLLSEAGQGSGFVVKRHTVVTVAHAVFDAATLSFVSNIRWSFQRYAGEYEPTPQKPRGSFVLGGYAAARTNDIINGLAPGESSLESRNLDVAALWFADDPDVAKLPGRGGQGGYLVTDSAGSGWLLTPSLKLLVGYPVEQVVDENKGKMHQVGPGSFQFEAVTNQVYRSFDLKSYPGNSGGPLCVYATNSSGQPFFIPAGVFLGGAGQTIVRAIDRDVVDIINQAEAASAAGGNSTGGGVAQWLGSSGSVPNAEVAFKIDLLPTGVSDTEAGWRIVGSNFWIADFSHWFVITDPAIASNLNIEFKPVGERFSTPSTVHTTVTLGQPQVIPANYLPVPASQLGVTPATDLSSSGTSGGPFAPGIITYTLTNSGGQNLSWLIGKSASWLTLSANSGSLASGASTTISVTVNSNANMLAAGIYSDTLTFNNQSDGGLGATNRMVSLTVLPNVPLMLTAPEVSNPGSFRLKLVGPSGRTYAIQLSTNLTAWNDLLFLTNTTGTNLFTNTPAIGADKQFFRARQLP